MKISTVNDVQKIGKTTHLAHPLVSWMRVSPSSVSHDECCAWRLSKSSTLLDTVVASRRPIRGG
eukprot:2166523-Rhodomonas_salina.1